ncbi:CAP domain-containing protein [Ruixingdingia sedimenti]|uniref:CAP domain-containing protein n=1 Tax=Ruixingdingia sedimenti TaxID=3073604 RepID=A0ABU1FCD9_9RHOB|nr:CAP domain-containing protein [Xinfangfangia sp. LG-4]MDR5654517.1 CAP domain-containing protein [Xinfangfangia sp. LG-4]
MIRRAALALLLAAALPGTAAAACTLAPQSAQAEAETLRAVNAARADAGAAPLTLDPRVTAAARRQACDIAAMGQLTHRGRDGSNVMGRLRAAGYPPRYASENAGAGLRSAAEAVAAWLGSPPHRKNMLNPNARHMGLGVVPTGGNLRTVWVLALAAGG